VGVRVALGTDLLAAPADTVPDAAFTANRAKLPARLGPIEGLGADISKVHKRIMEERDEFRSRDLSQRAANLPVTDPRRMAFYANSNDSFSKSVLSGLPVPSICFTHAQWSTAVALHFGVPIPALRAHIGKQIQSGTHIGGPFIVDARGQNLLTAPGLRDGHIQRNRNGTYSTISDGLCEAQISHRGGGTDRSCKGIFRNAIFAGD
jgi:hypothetical protein